MIKDIVFALLAFYRVLDRLFRYLFFLFTNRDGVFECLHKQRAAGPSNYLIVLSSFLDLLHILGDLALHYYRSILPLHLAFPYELPGSFRPFHGLSPYIQGL